MTFFSFLALALGMAAATADRVPRQTVVLIAVARGSRRAAAVRVEERVAARVSFPPARHSRVRVAVHRPLRRLMAPLRGTAAPRAPGAQR
ncbi:MAG TPA: hypothetical protein VEU30_10240 [Thermoanaerobaculia bacterium]|nr:hypothetical protein [Thermoanaerobaculia bacterium]